MPGMSSTPTAPSLDVACPYCRAEIVAERYGNSVCPACGSDIFVAHQPVAQKVPDEEIDRVRDEDEQAAERAVYGEAHQRRSRAIDGAIQTLTPLLAALAQNFVPGMGPTVPVAGRVECPECAEALEGSRNMHRALSAHLETAHDWWPADMEAALADSAKATTRVARGLRNVRFTEKTLLQDPYQAASQPETVIADGLAPDTTGTTPNSAERLAAVLAREGPSPLYDPSTDDLEPATPAVHVVSDDTPGSFLDGGGDAAPVVPEPDPTPVR